jgi:hypothetical protein
MNDNSYIYTSSPILKYLTIALVVVVFVAGVKIITTPPPVNYKTVTLNGKIFSYPVSEEANELEDMVATYVKMYAASEMNLKCVYLTPLDTETLKNNALLFRGIVEQVIGDAALKKQETEKLLLISSQSVNTLCNAAGRAEVEHFTHASRAIADGINALRY